MTSATARPHLLTVARRSVVSLLVANVVPALIFYVCLRAGSVWTALVAALAWCYGSMIWRVSTRRPMSGLLLVTAVCVTAKTVLAFASGSTFLYFLQPAITDVVVASLFLASLSSARPVAARLAGDFFPFDADVAQRPPVRRLFERLTMLWAGVSLVKATVRVGLLESMPTVDFYAVKELMILLVVAVAGTLTVRAALPVMRSEGLLGVTLATA